MKKIFWIAMLVFIISISINIVNISAEEDAFSYYLMEYDTGKVLKAKNEDAHHEIASMVKIMSLNIIFDEIEAQKLSFDDKVTISDNAARQTGSELFLDRGKEYSVYDLVKGIIVVSANDATVALAEKIANNEDNFVKMMNDKVIEYNLTNTYFVNPTGLPQDGQYSSAKDVSYMMKHLLEHEKYHEFATIWTEDYIHPGGRVTNLTNTNKLVRFYDGCDGGKTGFTNKAGFCLSATAKRGDMRLISTVIGASNGKMRFKVVSDNLNYGFDNYHYEVLKSKDELIDNDIKVKRGKDKRIDISLKNDVKSLIGKDNEDDVRLEYVYDKDVVAPINVGDKVGECKVYIGGEYSYSVDIISRSEVKKSSIFDNFLNITAR